MVLFCDMGVGNKNSTFLMGRCLLVVEVEGYSRAVSLSYIRQLGRFSTCYMCVFPIFHISIFQ
jgi:hypothetical protein